MVDHHHKNTPEAAAQVIPDTVDNDEIDSAAIESGADALRAIGIIPDSGTLPYHERLRIEGLYSKQSRSGYQPVITRDHGHPYARTLRTAALGLAEAGFYVLPCRPADTPDGREAKTPLTKNGFYDASNDANQISRWWSELPNTGTPDALIGLRTGLKGGVWVLDIDPEKIRKNGTKTGDGPTELKKLEAKFGPLPKTRTVRTPRGGHHYYFLMPDSVSLPSTSSRVAPGIDVRAEGGYAIAPPSMMGDGRKYEEISDADFAWAPDWLIQLAISGGFEKSRAKIDSRGWAYRLLARKCQDLTEAEEGTRNDTLNKAAFAVGRLVGEGQLAREAAFDALLDAAKKCGLEDTGAKATINSGLSAGADEKGDQPNFPDWTKAGPIKGSIDNVRAMLSWMGVKLRYNTFIERAEMSGFKDYTLLNDNAWAELWSAAHEYGFQPGKKFLADALEAISLQGKYHPVRDYFEGLAWDGIKRLEKLLITYAGAEDNEYVRAVGAKSLIAAARRIYVPGTKFDTMPVIEGIQGSGKSTMLRVLAIRDEWFADGLSLTDKTKEVIEQVEGCLIVEIQELSGMKGSEVSSTKSLLSKSYDKARKAYGRFTTNLPRQFVLFATTNPGGKGAYLKDKTGNRRFWPVKTGDEIDLASLRRDRDQLWAEAVHRHKAGESLFLPKHLWDVAKAEQEKRMAEHPWFTALEDHFGNMEGKVLVEDVWALLGKADAGRRAQYETEDLAWVMGRLGWRHSRLRKDGKPRYHYIRGTEAKDYKEIEVFTPRDAKPIVRYAKDGVDSSEF